MAAVVEQQEVRCRWAGGPGRPGGDHGWRAVTTALTHTTHPPRARTILRAGPAPTETLP